MSLQPGLSKTAVWMIATFKKIISSQLKLFRSKGGDLRYKSP